MFKSFKDPFNLDIRWLILVVIVLFICRYASVTGILASIHRWIYPNDSLITHPQVCIFGICSISYVTLLNHSRSPSGL